MLDYLVDVETDVVAFLYREDNLQDLSLLDGLEKIDDDLDERGIQLVKCSDRGVERHYGLGAIPAIVHFRHGVPLAFDGGDLEDAAAVLAWVAGAGTAAGAAAGAAATKEVSASVLDVLARRHGSLAALFYADGAELPEDPSPLELACERDAVTLVRIRDEGKAMQLGLERSRALVYFEDGLPSLYSGSLDNATEMAAWVTAQKKTHAMPVLTDGILENVVKDFDYVAVFFPGSSSCKSSDAQCRKAVDVAAENVEEVADAIRELGVVLVTCGEKVLAARDCNVTSFPALVLFRNGLPARYPFQLEEGRTAARIISWMSDTATLEVQGRIEKVNEAMLRNIVDSEDAVLVFFCGEDDKNLEDVMAELETVDDNLESEGVEFVWCSDPDAIDEYGLRVWPSLVYFARGVPVVFAGNLRSDDTILGWITRELQAEEEMPEVRPAVLDSLLDRLEFVAVVFHDGDPEERALRQRRALAEVAEEAKMHDIVFVSCSDPRLLARLGVDGELPALVYYENNIPSLYPGRLDDGGGLLAWLVRQRNMAFIEEVRDPMLDEIVEENEFVAVLFMGPCSEDEEVEETCARVLDNLEEVDSRLDEFGIVLVRTHDLGRARELWISRFPALVYFRNGEHVRFPGRVENSLAVLRWLTSEKTINVPGRILKVNALMLGKMSRRLKDMFVFFYEEGDILAERILGGLEELEDQLAEMGVDFVKVSEHGVTDEYDLAGELPVLGHFKGGALAVYFGDLRQRDKVAEWVEETTGERRQPEGKGKGIHRKSSRATKNSKSK